MNSLAPSCLALNSMKMIPSANVAQCCMLLGKLLAGLTSLGGGAVSADRVTMIIISKNNLACQDLSIICRSYLHISTDATVPFTAGNICFLFSNDHETGRLVVDNCVSCSKSGHFVFSQTFVNDVRIQEQMYFTLKIDDKLRFGYDILLNSSQSGKLFKTPLTSYSGEAHLPWPFLGLSTL